MLVKAQAGRVLVKAVDLSGPKTGDAANITAKLSKDGAAAATVMADHPTEIDATVFPGWYCFALTAEETDADVLLLQAESSTADVSIELVQVATCDQAALIAALLDTQLGDSRRNVGSIGEALQQARALAAGTRECVSGQVRTYAPDRATVLATHRLLPADTAPDTALEVGDRTIFATSWGVAVGTGNEGAIS